MPPNANIKDIPHFLVNSLHIELPSECRIISYIHTGWMGTAGKHPLSMTFNAVIKKMRVVGKSLSKAHIKAHKEETLWNSLIRL